MSWEEKIYIFYALSKIARIGFISYSTCLYALIFCFARRKKAMSVQLSKLLPFIMATLRCQPSVPWEIYFTMQCDQIRLEEWVAYWY